MRSSEALSQSKALKASKVSHVRFEKASSVQALLRAFASIFLLDHFITFRWFRQIRGGTPITVKWQVEGGSKNLGSVGGSTIVIKDPEIFHWRQWNLNFWSSWRATTCFIIFSSMDFPFPFSLISIPPRALIDSDRPHAAAAAERTKSIKRDNVLSPVFRSCCSCQMKTSDDEIDDDSSHFHRRRTPVSRRTADFPKPKCFSCWPRAHQMTLSTRCNQLQQNK